MASEDRTMIAGSKIASTALAAVVIGGILAAAQWYSPALLPWVTGFMLACLAANLSNVLQ
jgi:hypothetical protein